ncbi:MAG TPA: exopolysaccharide biosynthesis polyprenyl glycosylphosphotransferase [Solirubrobacteraceae bacterium]
MASDRPADTNGAAPSLPATVGVDAFDWRDVVGDALVLALAVAAAAIGASLGVDVSVAWCSAQAVATLVLLYLRRAEPRTLQRAPIEDVAQVLAVTANAAIAILALRAVVGDADGAAVDAVRMWAFASVYLAVRHNEAAWARRRAQRRGKAQVPTLLIGAGAIGHRVARRLIERPELGLRPIGFLDADPLPAPPGAAALPVLGAPDDIEEVLAEHGAGHVIVTFSRSNDEQLVGLVRTCQRRGIDVSVVPRLFEAVTGRVSVQHLGGIALLRSEHVDPAGWRFAIKYAGDRVVGTAILVLVMPLMGIVALAVKLSSPGPVFFRQRRIGRDRREFTMLKFRTMTGDPEVDGEADAAWAAENTDGARAASLRRVTRTGHVLRALCLDELPQLLNVARGEMSLVGPRPERVGYVEQFEGRIRRYDDRHRVKSGLTGWAQVNGLRGETSLADRVEYDNYYIENWGLLLDLRILALTLPSILLMAMGSLGRRDEHVPEVGDPDAAKLSLAQR